jgi:DNA-binding HxlR family transcriptional regulator
METVTGCVYDPACPTRETLARIADKWTLLVTGVLGSKTKRFSELRRDIPGISQKMLTQTLRSLERDGLVTRTIYPEIPPRVEYALTPLGRSLDEPLAAVRAWAEANIAAVRDAQAQFDGAASASAA